MACMTMRLCGAQPSPCIGKQLRQTVPSYSIDAALRARLSPPAADPLPPSACRLLTSGAGLHPFAAMDPADLPELIVAESKGDVIAKTWAFCPITGDLLILDAAAGVARSERADFSRPLSDLDDTMTVVTTSDMDVYMRQYAMEPLIKSREQLEFEELLKNRVRATVEEPCPRCGNPILEYYTMQLRSADEGQVGGGGQGWVSGLQHAGCSARCSARCCLFLVSAAVGMLSMLLCPPWPPTACRPSSTSAPSATAATGTAPTTEGQWSAACLPAAAPIQSKPTHAPVNYSLPRVSSLPLVSSLLALSRLGSLLPAHCLLLTTSILYVQLDSAANMQQNKKQEKQTTSALGSTAARHGTSAVPGRRHNELVRRVMWIYRGRLCGAVRQF